MSQYAHAQLKALRTRSGYSQQKLADLLSMPQSSYAAYERETYKRQFIPQELALKLEPALVGRGTPPITREEVFALAGMAVPSSAPATPASQPQEQTQRFAPVAVESVFPTGGPPMVRDMPVYGTAQGGTEGTFLLNMTGGPIDFVLRPPALAKAKTVFVIYVEGDSMVPWREPGEMVFVHETRQPAPGDYAIIVLRPEDEASEPRAVIKRMVKRTASYIEVEQFNPPKTIKYPTSEVFRLYRVLTQSEVVWGV